MIVDVIWLVAKIFGVLLIVVIARAVQKHFEVQS